MLRKILVLTTLVTVFFTAGFTANADKKETTMDAIYVPVGELVLAPPVGVISKRSAVAFPHSRHFGYTCITCHHTWDGQAQVQGCSTSGCHDQRTVSVDKQTNPNAKADWIYHFKYAFHKQCIGCHKEIAAHNAEMANSISLRGNFLQRGGPTGCANCHPKE